MKYVFFFLTLIAFFSFTACTGNGPVVAPTQIAVTYTTDSVAHSARYNCDKVRLSKDKLDSIYHLQKTVVVTCPTCPTNDTITDNFDFSAWFTNWQNWPWWVFLLITIPLLLIWWAIHRNANGTERIADNSTPDRWNVRSSPAPEPEREVEVVRGRDYSKQLSSAINVAGKRGGKVVFNDGDIILELDTNSPYPPVAPKATRKAPAIKSEKPATPAENQQG